MSYSPAQVLVMCQKPNSKCTNTFKMNVIRSIVPEMTTEHVKKLGGYNKTLELVSYRRNDLKIIYLKYNLGILTKLAAEKTIETIIYNNSKLTLNGETIEQEIKDVVRTQMSYEYELKLREAIEEFPDYPELDLEDYIYRINDEFNDGVIFNVTYMYYNYSELWLSRSRDNSKENLLVYEFDDSNINKKMYKSVEDGLDLGMDEAFNKLAIENPELKEFDT